MDEKSKHAIQISKVSGSKDFQMRPWAWQQRAGCFRAFAVSRDWKTHLLQSGDENPFKFDSCPIVGSGRRLYAVPNCIQSVFWGVSSLAPGFLIFSSFLEFSQNFFFLQVFFFLFFMVSFLSMICIYIYILTKLYAPQSSWWGEPLVIFDAEIPIDLMLDFLVKTHPNLCVWMLRSHCFWFFEICCLYIPFKCHDVIIHNFVDKAWIHPIGWMESSLFRRVGHSLTSMAGCSCVFLLRKGTNCSLFFIFRHMCTSFSLFFSNKLCFSPGFSWSPCKIF